MAPLFPGVPLTTGAVRFLVGSLGLAMAIGFALIVRQEWPIRVRTNSNEEDTSETAAPLEITDGDDETADTRNDDGPSGIQAGPDNAEPETLPESGFTAESLVTSLLTKRQRLVLGGIFGYWLSAGLIFSAVIGSAEVSRNPVLGSFLVVMTWQERVFSHIDWILGIGVSVAIGVTGLWLSWHGLRNRSPARVAGGIILVGMGAGAGYAIYGGWLG